MDWLTARLSENSTWRGIIALLTAGGIRLQPDLQNAIIAAGLALIGLINVIRGQKNAPAANDNPTKG